MECNKANTGRQGGFFEFVSFHLLIIIIPINAKKIIILIDSEQKKYMQMEPLKLFTAIMQPSNVTTVRIKNEKASFSNRFAFITL